MNDGGGPSPQAPEGWWRLAAALHIDNEPGHIEPGDLASFAEINASEGRAAADRDLPHVAEHLADGCTACTADLWDLRLFIRNGREIAGNTSSPPGTQEAPTYILPASLAAARPQRRPQLAALIPTNTGLNDAPDTSDGTDQLPPPMPRLHWPSLAVLSTAAALLLVWYATGAGRQPDASSVAAPVSTTSAFGVVAVRPTSTSTGSTAVAAAPRAAFAPAPTLVGSDQPSSTVSTAPSIALLGGTSNASRATTTPVPTPPYLSTRYVVANTGGSGLPILQSPSGNRLDLLSDGDYVLDLGQEWLIGDRKWRRIRSDRGIEGWVATEFLALVK